MEKLFIRCTFLAEVNEYTSRFFLYEIQCKCFACLCELLLLGGSDANAAVDVEAVTSDVVGTFVDSKEASHSGNLRSLP